MIGLLQNQPFYFQAFSAKKTEHFSQFFPDIPLKINISRSDKNRKNSLRVKGITAAESSKSTGLSGVKAKCTEITTEMVLKSVVEA